MNPQCCGIENVFDDKEAQKKLRRYRRKGVQKPTRNLIDAIRRNTESPQSLLDVGGGIGVIQLEMIRSGVSTVKSVDASPAYIKAAREEAAKQGVEDKIVYQKGDFAEDDVGEETFDVVSLDKVICCYPEAVLLLEKAGDVANQAVALTYPVDNFLSRTLAKIANVFVRLFYKNFQGYIHSEKLIAQIMEQKKFRKVHNERSGIWKVVVWKR